MLIFFFIFVWKLGRKIWTYNLLLMCTRQWYICDNISQKLKISVYKSWKKQPRKPFRAKSIIMTHSRQSLELTLVIVIVLFRRQLSKFSQNWSLGGFFRLCVLLTPVFQRKEFQYYFLNNNLVNYRMITFSRNQILIVIWKDQGQHSAMENAVF